MINLEEAGLDDILKGCRPHGGYHPPDGHGEIIRILVEEVRQQRQFNRDQGRHLARLLNAQPEKP